MASTESLGGQDFASRAEAPIPWPVNENLPFLGQEVAQQLLRKDFCVVQSLLSPEVAAEALNLAKKLSFKRLVKELEVCYLGRDIGSEKVAWLPPEDPRSQVTTPLESCDRMLSKLASGLYLECSNLGFLPDGRSDGLVRLPCRSKADRQEMLREQEKLNARLVRDGRIEDHIDFLQSRKVCAMLQVTGSAKVVLNDRQETKAELLLEGGQVLVFRHDHLSFSYEGLTSDSGMPSCIQTWILSTGYSAELQAAVGNLAEADLAMGVMSGPLSPVNPKTGKTVSVMAVDCMLAGNGVSPEQYWSMLSVGTDGCRHLSSLRWDSGPYFEADKDMALGKYYSNHGGFVMEEYLMGFDSGFFGVTESQALLMDPIQRNSLEVGYSILLKAGWNRHRLRDANIGVYLGNCGTDWGTVKNPAQLLAGSSEGILENLASQSAHVTSTRLSYTFGMRGPISSSDTACSSSLVATGSAHNAMRPVDPGQGKATCCGVEHALVLGTNALLGPYSWIGLCGPKMLSVKGRCFTFDYGADGFGRGEGTSGLFAEVTHKEPVERLAIFCGTCVNQDGRSASMTAPHGPSQQECIRASLKEANVTPTDIRVAELHGTGTALGDPIEVGALRGVMKDRNSPIVKTSAKSNLAHGEANAGMAGLVKCVMMLSHSCVAPNVHFYSLNPHLDLNGYPCQISGEMLELGTTSGYAGVSSFGFGGTNARADIWGKARVGMRKIHKLDLNMLENVYVRCPKCLGGMEWKNGCAEPSRRPKGQGYGRQRASCVRDEFDSYEFCSLCYEGSYAYGSPPPAEEPLPATGKLYIKGTWTAFSKFEEMTEKDSAFHFQLRLGETRCERFYVALDKKEDQAIFPWHPSGEADVRVKGPCKMEPGHYFFIDGRDEEWPEGSLVSVIAWFEGEQKRKIIWQRQVEEGGPREMPSFQHSYQVLGSLTQMKMIPMKATRGLRNVFEYSTRFGLQSYETFQFVRDNDRDQTIYPARTMPKSTSVPVRGPDAAGSKNFFAVSGRQGERLQLRLEVADGHVVVSAIVSSGTRTWHSQEGRNRRRYYVAGNWAERGILMSQDSENPDRYWAKMTMASRSGRAEFQIWIDEDPHRALFPEAPNSSSGGCMLGGPGISDNKFVIDGYAGTSFEICLDLKSSHKWRTVTWTKLPDQVALW